MLFPGNRDKPLKFTSNRNVFLATYMEIKNYFKQPDQEKKMPD